MDPVAFSAASPIQPIEALIETAAPAVLAVIVAVDGPSYRPLGAMMAVIDRQRRVGSLSSGCVESDIALHAERALETGTPGRVRYGTGSPFKDIQLPCGGGLDILLIPDPDRAVLCTIRDRHRRRQTSTIAIGPDGALSLRQNGATGWRSDVFHVRIRPEIRFLVFGKGPEASTFAALVQAAGFPNTVLSPDLETLAAAEYAGCDTRHMVEPAFPGDLRADARTAIVLFFHDHEWEPPILAPALASKAFYIGAQGSRRARLAREYELEALGVAPDTRARMKGPIGLVPSARDARTLAVSVLAEVLADRPED